MQCVSQLPWCWTPTKSRITWGKGLEHVQQLAAQNLLALRSQPGIRIGLLLVDNDILIWSPTPRAVETLRTKDEPNGVDLRQDLVPLSTSEGDTPDSQRLPDGAQIQRNFLADVIQNAVGADESNVPLNQAEIGREVLTPALVEKTVNALKENPPTPFDLTRKSGVFSSKYQYVEFELRGAEWTQREIKLSSLLLNSDVPNDLQELFETRIKPFSHQVDVTVEVPALVQGQIAHTRDGHEILIPMTQADIEKEWRSLRQRYLRQLPGFGWLIRRVAKEQFKDDISAFETVLKAWVTGFRKIAANEQKILVHRIVDLIQSRVDRSQAKEKITREDIQDIVSEGIDKLRVIEPSVKLLFKEISWESAKDEEFTSALHKVIPADELKGWFEVFTAARERPK